MDPINRSAQILHSYLGEQAPIKLAHQGNLDILAQPLVAVFCSVKCPGSLILKAYELSLEICQANIPVIGGFHAPVEKDALTVLLRGEQALVVCLARGLEGIRLPKEHERALQAGRLLLVSAFPATVRRPTDKTTTLRNRIVGALAERILIVHAAPGGKLEGLCKEFVQWGKPVYALADGANQHLIEVGAKGVVVGQIVEQMNG